MPTPTRMHQNHYVPPIRLGNEFLCTVRDSIIAKIFRGMITVKSLLKKSYSGRKIFLICPILPNSLYNYFKWVMTFDLRSFLYERSHLYFIIICMKGNNQATFNTIITPFRWGPFWGLNARSPLQHSYDP